MIDMPRKRKSLWNPPYPSTKVTGVHHWTGAKVNWSSPVDLLRPGSLDRCLAVLCPVYDVMIRRQLDGDMYIMVDDFGKGFRVR